MGTNWNSAGAAAKNSRPLCARNFSPSQFFIACFTPGCNHATLYRNYSIIIIIIIITITIIINQSINHYIFQANAKTKVKKTT